MRWDEVILRFYIDKSSDDRSEMLNSKAPPHGVEVHHH
jgi:hypothetical protein